MWAPKVVAAIVFVLTSVAVGEDGAGGHHLQADTDVQVGVAINSTLSYVCCPDDDTHAPLARPRPHDGPPPRPNTEDAPR